ncbi:probable G-protein coupled receptor Mth-like 5 isoform X1 [Neodiprion lecontei]|uniref:Probable G-protein coupled receptor Mth-like 5 isoform X1 n=2 Tax=Neodiprion lecontei TaxID=441921 RepID=A0A6J0BWU5_NEOLC|nr:probable G-protein coupled receptor Mth-like 5 isoform X1 [Neodiprion lecontei]
MHIMVMHVTLIIVRITVGLAMYQGSSASSSDEGSVATIKIGKCCKSNELIVDDRCTPIKEATHGAGPWKPIFTDEDGHGLTDQPKFELKFGLPKCKNDERQWKIYDVPNPPNMDLLRILSSGKLRHCTQCNLDNTDSTADELVEGERNNAKNKRYYDYEFGTYCADKTILRKENMTTFYARVCLPIKKHVMHTDVMMRRVIDPSFRAISIACYLVVAIVYFVLPQLKNLIGNIVTSLMLCLVANHCAAMVRIFPEFGSHVNFLVADVVMYVSLMSAFFWLSSLGYYIWKTFRSRNIFLRSTDGKKYCYYSLYVWSLTTVIGTMAIFSHFKLDTNKPMIVDVPDAPQETIGWLAVAVLFTPVAFSVIFNVWFVATTTNFMKRMNTYGRIHHKMKYSFRMFVFLFIIMGVAWSFTLLSWMRSELEYCSIVINLLQAILILYVCVFGQRRVTFLLRKTCNCCSPGDTAQGLDWGEEMTAINLG